MKAYENEYEITLAMGSQKELFIKPEIYIHISAVLLKFLIMCLRRHANLQTWFWIKL